MSKILLIGNSGLRKNQIDGQTTKVRLYLKKIKDEGYDVNFVDLELFFKKPISTFIAIKKGIKTCDRIVLLTATRGCKILIPYINFCNKKFNKPFVLPLIGISVLHYSFDKLSLEKRKDFILNKNYELIKPKQWLIKELKKITIILPETDLLTSIFREYYGINNVFTLTNFREISQCSSNVKINEDDVLRLVFISRVQEIKGIFDLIHVVNSINKNKKFVNLDIYGEKFFSKNEENLFDSLLSHSSNIQYKGILNNNKVIDTIKKYDLLVFPTIYEGEGTPGIIVESLIAGVPVLSSSFYQYKFLLKDNYDSIIYKQFDNDDLNNKLNFATNNKLLINKMKDNALQSGNKYTYSFNRDNFIKFVCGKKD